jgi:hypothetical protein
MYLSVYLSRRLSNTLIPILFGYAHLDDFLLLLLLFALTYIMHNEHIYHTTYPSPMYFRPLNVFAFIHILPISSIYNFTHSLCFYWSFRFVCLS